MIKCKYQPPQGFHYSIFWQVSKLTLTLEQAFKKTNTTVQVAVSQHHKKAKKLKRI